MEAMALSTSSEKRRPAPATPAGDGSAQKPRRAELMPALDLPHRAKLLWRWEQALLRLAGTHRNTCSPICSLQTAQL
uniref:Uncharacterized protein n=1 Tax=Catharus ustulatus TaxID=91951 RepID=A0A8C3UGV2_CATUS